MHQIPKLAIPLRTALGGAFATVEQDSADELAACVYAVLATPKGSRLEAPGYGVVDPTFDILPLNLTESLAAIREWEPRAEVSTTEEIEGMTERISYGVGGGLGSQLGSVAGAEFPMPPLDIREVEGCVIHGADASTLRPIGFRSVIWIGSVVPENLLESDLFVNTTEASISVGT